MARETKPTPRADNPTKPHTKGIIRARNWAASTTWGSQVLGTNIKSGFLKNTGGNNLRIRFNTDPAPQFYVLLPDEVVGPLQFKDSTQVFFRTASGTGTLSAILMG